MLNRMLSMGFEKWQYEAAKMKAERDALSRSLMHMLHRMLSRAWNKWRAVAGFKTIVCCMSEKERVALMRFMNPRFPSLNPDLNLTRSLIGGS